MTSMVWYGFQLRMLAKSGRKFQNQVNNYFIPILRTSLNNSINSIKSKMYQTRICQFENEHEIDDDKNNTAKELFVLLQIHRIILFLMS